MARRSDHTREQLKEMAIAAASQIITSDGIRELSIRRIAKKIGYTSGTLYQLFENLDALIVEVHITTLDDMFGVLKTVEFGEDSEASLLALASKYAANAGANKNRWNALFSHSLPDEKALPERYTMAVNNLIGLCAIALGPIFDEATDGEQKAQHEARALWASFYGIIALDSAKKLPALELADELTKSLVLNYVAGLRARKSTSYTKMG